MGRRNHAAGMRPNRDHRRVSRRSWRWLLRLLPFLWWLCHWLLANGYVVHGRSVTNNRH